MAALEQRSGKILQAIIAEYISTGEPVGSRTLARKTDIGLSAASIRNVMSDLTESGYITQPHVSAGRIPTDLGYRFFVDAMVAPGAGDHEQRATIEALIHSASLDVRDLLRKSSSVLAGLSKQAGVVATAAVQEQTFKTIEFIKVSEERILVVLVSSSGHIQSKIIHDEVGTSQETLERYSRMLTDMLKDLDLREARERIEQELRLEKTQVDAILAKALRLSHVILSHDASREIFIEGQANILEEPEFAHISTLKAVLATFEEKSNLLRILDHTLEAQGVQILIGSEHGLDEIESCAIVAYPIRANTLALGSIAVVGPKRMNYQRMVRLVETTAQVMTHLLRRIVENTV
jgi:heat-inducible transcriptional repressor